MRLMLADVASLLGGVPVGRNVCIRGIGTSTNARAGDVVFVREPHQLAHAAAGKASALVVKPDVRVPRKPLVHVPNPGRALITMLEAIGQAPAWQMEQPGVSPLADVASDVRFGRGSCVGAFARVEQGVVVGRRTRIHSHAVIGRGCRIGNDAVIHPHAVLYPQVVLGDRVIVHAGAVLGADGFNYQVEGQSVHKVPHLGTVVLGDDVEIGPNTCIDRGIFGMTRIGNGSKIDDLVMIAHDVQAGERCGITAQCAIGGDTVLGDDTVLMGQVGVRDSIVLSPGTLVLAQSCIVRDTVERGVYSGYPAKLHAEQKREWAALARLPALLKQRAPESENRRAP